MLQRECKTNISASEQDLFAVWRQKIMQQGKVFVPDGVVNPDKWTQAERKTLFLLKEVNGGEQEWDERDYLRYYNSEPRYCQYPLSTNQLSFTSLFCTFHSVYSHYPSSLSKAA